jgi:type III pantothenate kinase
MNLVLDIGNTRCKWAVFRNNEMLASGSSKLFSIDFLRTTSVKYNEIKNVCISDNTNVGYDYKTIFSNLNIDYIEISHKCKLPITISYVTPKTLGSDRIALSVAASQRYSGHKLIIDLGTCITYDLVLHNDYIGGQISPGLNMRLAALNHYTGKLPKLDFCFSDLLVGDSTKNSILIGVYDSIFFEIANVIEKYKTRYPKLVTIVTGGDMNIIEKKIKSINFYHPYLLMEGLNSIIAFNEEV